MLALAQPSWLPDVQILHARFKRLDTHEDFTVICTFCKDHLWLEKSDARVKLWINCLYRVDAPEVH